MARPLRIEFPDAVYHVTSRGNRQDAIFADDVDRQQLLLLWENALKRFDACALAWCLLDNHYHIVLQTRQANLSALMRQINGTYTQAFNRRHGNTGHVFQGRFKAILIDRDKFLLAVCRHVELNSLRLKLCKEIAQWPWSSYAQLTGRLPPEPWLDAPTVWTQLLGHSAETSSDKLQAHEAYANYVAAGVGKEFWVQQLRQQVYLGDEEFVTRMQALARNSMPTTSEVPRAQRAQPHSLAQWLQRCSGRNQAIYKAHTQSFMNFSEIARELGLSTSRISRIVKSFDNQPDDFNTDSINPKPII